MSTPKPTKEPNFDCWAAKLWLSTLAALIVYVRRHRPKNPDDAEAQEGGDTDK